MKTREDSIETRILTGFEGTMDQESHHQKFHVEMNDAGWWIIECTCGAAWVAYSTYIESHYAIGPHGTLRYEQLDGPLECAPQEDE